MSNFTDYCAEKGKFKLRIWLKPEFRELATGVTTRNDPFVDKFSFPKLDKRNEQMSIERLEKLFLKEKYFGQYRFAQVFQQGINGAIKTIKG